jgi:glycosyltransferase involved in cell wall biosynthesis
MPRVFINLFLAQKAVFINLLVYNISMRILFLVNSFAPAIGGAEKVCSMIVETLSTLGEVTILTQPHPYRFNKTGFIELEAKGPYSYMPGLAKYINSHDFDLYVSFGYGKYFTDYIGWYTKSHNKTSIVMPCGSFHTNSNQLFKTIYAKLLTAWSLNNYTARITATDWERQFWISKGVKKENSFVIPYNLEKNFTKFKPTNILKKYGLKKKGYLLYIGRAGPNKLIDLLKQAYFRTNKKIPLVIAGKGTGQFNYLGSTVMYTKSISPEKRWDIINNFNILSLGAVSEDEKKTLIKNAKLCIFTSSYESFGMVILESIALGTPVIGSDIGPFRELLGADKYLFKNDPISLRNKLIETKLSVPKIKLPNFKDRLLFTISYLRLKDIPGWKK